MVAKNVEHLKKCVLPIFISSFENALFSSVPHFKKGYLFSHYEFWSSLYSLHTNSLTYVYLYFCPAPSQAVLHLNDGVLRQRVFRRLVARCSHLKLRLLWGKCIECLDVALSKLLTASCCEIFSVCVQQSFKMK